MHGPELKDEGFTDPDLAIHYTTFIGVRRRLWQIGVADSKYVIVFDPYSRVT